MRLIDADEAIINFGFEWDDISPTRDEFVAFLKKQSTIDAVPVVRCKDCKWFADNNGGEWYGCYMFHVVRITPEDAPKPDDFCSYGERKNGGDSDV